MLASVTTVPIPMPINTPPNISSSLKRPRLSLQIKTPFTATMLRSNTDPASPTTFNTLSNAYAIAIEKSSPKMASPTSADGRSSKPTYLRLETKNFSSNNEHKYQQAQTPGGAFAVAYLDTPNSAFPSLVSSTANTSNEKKTLPKSDAFTPPQSAGPENSMPRVFDFTAAVGSKSTPSTSKTPRRSSSLDSQRSAAPYTHPQSLRSILRNSPLPRRNSTTLAVPSRTSNREVDGANKKVGYNDPLTQTITTNKYTKSHIDLLVEDSSCSTLEQESKARLDTIEVAMDYTGDGIIDDVQTPGPLEETRQNLDESGFEECESQKRQRREKKRKWEWTISTADIGREVFAGMPLTALRIEKTPITAIRRGGSVSDDSEMLEAGERYIPSVSSDSDGSSGMVLYYRSSNRWTDIGHNKESLV